MRETRIPFMQSLIGKVWDGSKPITRRVNGLQKINAEPHRWTLLGNGCGIFTFASTDEPTETRLIKCPYGGPGDILLPTETWATQQALDDIAPSDLLKYIDGRKVHATLFYRARPEPESEGIRGRWRPPMFMPKWASRGRLEILSVRAERLQEITDQDCVAEGVPMARIQDAPDDSRGPLIDGFRIAWDAAYPKLMWSLDPYVWRIEFRRVS